MQAVLFFLILCLAFYSFVVSAIQYTPEVQTQSGRIRGLLTTISTGDVVRKYLGIPYAQADRFEYPGSPISWAGVKDMVTVGKACYQDPRSSPFGAFLEDMDEDCLHLNVFVPDKYQGAALPVMFWIHGGAYLSNSYRNYDGSYLATIGKVIVVTINYRLNVFGFLATGNSSSDLKGNYGMMDQLQALKWVKRNIKVFGGDPKRVTIFGNSAGGASVSLLCLSPLSKGLFKYAIMQSGVSNTAIGYGSYSDVAEFAKNTSRKLGCSDFRNLTSCLKSKSAGQISKAFKNIFAVPMIDRYFLLDNPNILLEKGMFPKRNILLGVAEDDGSCFTNAIPELSPFNNVTNGMNRKRFVEWITIRSKLIAETKPAFVAAVIKAIIYHYTDWTKIDDRFRNRRMFIDFITDFFFIAPGIRHANAYAKHGSKTYFYQVEHQVKQGVTPRYFNVASWVNTYHEAEKFMVFGYPLSNVSSDLLYTKDANFSRTMIQMWTNFAKTGNPNNPGSNAWPDYDLQNQQYMALKPNMVVKSKLRAADLAFWNDFLPKLKSVLPDCRKTNQTRNKQDFQNDQVLKLFPKWY